MNLVFGIIFLTLTTSKASTDQLQCYVCENCGDNEGYLEYCLPPEEIDLQPQTEQGSESTVELTTPYSELETTTANQVSSETTLGYVTEPTTLELLIPATPISIDTLVTVGEINLVGGDTVITVDGSGTSLEGLNATHTQNITGNEDGKEFDRVNSTLVTDLGIGYGNVTVDGLMRPTDGTEPTYENPSQNTSYMVPDTTGEVLEEPLEILQIMNATAFNAEENQKTDEAEEFLTNVNTFSDSIVENPNQSNVDSTDMLTLAEAVDGVTGNTSSVGSLNETNGQFFSELLGTGLSNIGNVDMTNLIQPAELGKGILNFSNISKNATQLDILNGSFNDTSSELSPEGGPATLSVVSPNTLEEVPLNVAAPVGPFGNITTDGTFNDTNVDLESSMDYPEDVIDLVKLLESAGGIMEDSIEEPESLILNPVIGELIGSNGTTFGIQSLTIATNKTDLTMQSNPIKQLNFQPGRGTSSMVGSQPQLLPTNRYRRSFIGGQMRQANLTYKCYTVQVKGKNKIQINKGCIAVPAGKAACALLTNKFGEDVLEDCRVCRGDKCNRNHGVALRFAKKILISILLVGWVFC